MKYIGVKIVDAVEMTSGEAISKGYSTGNMVGDNEPGYEVTYEDGYKSWCPKSVFEKANRPFETAKDRVRVEYEDLVKKGIALKAFLDSEKMFDLTVENQNLLGNQHDSMHRYEIALMQRLERWQD